jgi:hypothetical protein
MHSPTTLISVSERGLPPLDIATYEVRRQRANEGVGPVLVGINEFADSLFGLAERAIAVRGERTTYVYLVDAALSRVLAGVAINSPSGEAALFRDEP